MKIAITGGSGFIGTNLISSLLSSGHGVLNLDDSPASLPAHAELRIAASIMDPNEIASAIIGFQPDMLIHLAARVECDENTTVEKGYEVNVEGTENVLKAIKRCPSIKRVIITSTQFVCGPGRLPSSDTDYYPHTVYGQSKVETENLTREADLDCEWVIIRPVNIWGPYHARYSREFWRIASRGLYFHPGVPCPTRTYGYVQNVVWQIEQMLDAPSSKVDRQVFYVGDKPIKTDRWVMGFCEEFRGRRPRVIPMPIMKLLAMGGDLVSKVTGKPFYINSSRLRSMTEDYFAPMDKTFEAFGEPPYSLEEGIRETVAWFKSKEAPCRRR